MSRRDSIDLNADVGEGFASDADLIPLVTSVNIACGAHAGDGETMRRAVELALRHGTAIGAHPGFADREHFGRREISMAPALAAALVVEQAMLLEGVASGLGARVGHVKLHGALYNMAARDRALAAAVVDALLEAGQRGGPRWTLVAIAGSEMVSIGRDRGLIVAAEAFADRRYRRDGTLAPRSDPGAVIADEGAAAIQAVRIATEGDALCADGSRVPVDADTICVHGDGPHAVPFARRVRAELAAAGLALRRWA